MKWPFASVSSIIASSEKDTYYISLLEDKLKQLVLDWVNPVDALKLSRSCAKIATFMYFTLTWMNSSLTLGEEFSLIQPVDTVYRTLPSKFTRFFYILMHCALLPSLPKWLKKGLFPLNLIFFYYNGKYADLTRRILGIRYVNTNNRADKRFEPAFLLLGICTLVNAFYDVYESHQALDAPAQPAQRETCSLCMSKRVESAVTLCGHVFCYSCLVEWLQKFPQCPLCRKPCSINAIYTVNL